MEILKNGIDGKGKSGDACDYCRSIIRGGEKIDKAE